MTPNKNQVGIRIKEIRVALGMKQRQFANLLGVSISAVSNWEQGRNLPDSKILTDISFYGQVPVSFLLYGYTPIKEWAEIKLKSTETKELTEHTRGYKKALQDLQKELEKGGY